MLGKFESSELEGLFFDTSDFDLKYKVIGEGSFGIAFLAQNNSDDQLYAAKIIKTDDQYIIFYFIFQIRLRSLWFLLHSLSEIELREGSSVVIKHQE